MQLLPMASSPDGLISARYAVITKTPGGEVLTTTSNVNVAQRGGGSAFFWVGGWVAFGVAFLPRTTPQGLSCLSDVFLSRFVLVVVLLDQAL